VQTEFALGQQTVMPAGLYVVIISLGQ